MNNIRTDEALGCRRMEFVKSHRLETRCVSVGEPEKLRASVCREEGMPISRGTQIDKNSLQPPHFCPTDSISLFTMVRFGTHAILKKGPSLSHPLFTEVELIGAVMKESWLSS